MWISFWIAVSQIKWDDGGAPREHFSDESHIDLTAQWAAIFLAKLMMWYHRLSVTGFEFWRSRTFSADLREFKHFSVISTLPNLLSRSAEVLKKLIEFRHFLVISALQNLLSRSTDVLRKLIEFRYFFGDFGVTETSKPICWCSFLWSWWNWNIFRWWEFSLPEVIHLTAHLVQKCGSELRLTWRLNDSSNDVGRLLWVNLLAPIIHHWHHQHSMHACLSEHFDW